VSILSKKVKRHAHEVAFASTLEVATKTVLVFGKTLLVDSFHGLKNTLNTV
jgi:hypothetical protein